MNEINGILLLYRQTIKQNANTILEHINAFERNSRFKVWAINTEFGFPKELNNFHFKVIVIHYSIFKTQSLNPFKPYLKKNKNSYKIAFFQDEHHNCLERFEFINEFEIDCIFSCIEPQFFKDTYYKFTNVRKIIHCLTGYVSDDLIEASIQYTLPDEDRTIDIGYRGRKLSYYMGQGGQEKTEIAEKFLLRTKKLGFRLDIDTQERNRIYGDDWYKFLANCRGVLGVESGVTIFDIDGTLIKEYYNFTKTRSYDELIEFESGISFEEVARELHFEKYENKIPLRTISPRHFEAAAFRICQILYEGNYSGIMKPMVHYIPLKKDFSNFEEVITLFKDPNIRHQLTENTYNDLINSGRYHYKKFIEEFDEILIEQGYIPDIDIKSAENISLQLRKSIRKKYLIALFTDVFMVPLRGIFYKISLHNQKKIKRILLRFGIN